MNSVHLTSPGKRIGSLLKMARGRLVLPVFSRDREEECDAFLNGVPVLQGVELDLASIEEAVESFLSGPEPAGEPYAITKIVGTGDHLSATCDRVLRQAVHEGICAESVVAADGSSQRKTWREVARTHPELSGPLHKLAAITYGFEPVMICEMSTLVLADLLSSVMKPEEWKQCFDLGLIPVVEHGEAPEVQNGTKIKIAAWDPCKREIREFAAGLAQVRGTLCYAAKHAIEGLQDLVIDTVPGMASMVRPARPMLRKVEQVFSTVPEYSKAA